MNNLDVKQILENSKGLIVYRLDNISNPILGLSFLPSQVKELNLVDVYTWLDDLLIKRNKRQVALHQIGESLINLHFNDENRRLLSIERIKIDSQNLQKINELLLNSNEVKPFEFFIKKERGYQQFDTGNIITLDQITFTKSI